MKIYILYVHPYMFIKAALKGISIWIQISQS